MGFPSNPPCPPVVPRSPHRLPVVPHGLPSSPPRPPVVPHGFPISPPRPPVVPHGLSLQSTSPASCPTWAFPAIPLARQLSHMGFPGVPLARQLPHVGSPRSPCPPVGPGVFLHCSPASCPTWASQQTPANSFLYSPCYVVCRAVKAGCHQDPLRSSVAKRSSVWNEELMALCRQQAWELGGTTVSATWMEFPAFGPWAGAPMLQLASFSQPYRLLLSFDLRAFLLVIVQRWAVAKNPCFLWCIPAPEAIRVCQRALGFGQRFVRFKAVSAQLCFWFKASKKKLRWSW